jgi:VanZ family protein
MLFTAIAGAIDEFHQTFTVGRTGNDFFDWLADLSGGLLGGMIALLFLNWVRRAVAVPVAAE